MRFSKHYYKTKNPKELDKIIREEYRRALAIKAKIKGGLNIIKDIERLKKEGLI